MRVAEACRLAMSEVLRVGNPLGAFSARERSLHRQGTTFATKEDGAKVWGKPGNPPDLGAQEIVSFGSDITAGTCIALWSSCGTSRRLLTARHTGSITVAAGFRTGKPNWTMAEVSKTSSISTWHWGSSIPDLPL